MMNNYDSNGGSVYLASRLGRVVFFCTLTLFGVCAGGEIVIDDFTLKPQSAGQVESRTVKFDAALGGAADRILTSFDTCNVLSPHPCPQVTADIGSSLFSMSMIDLPSAEDRQEHSAFVLFVQLHETMDFTEGGANDAIRIDFAYSRGPTPFQNLLVSPKTTLGQVVHGLNDPFPITEYPFSRYLSMSDFRTRSGEVRPDGFERITAIEFQFQSKGNVLFGPQGEDLGWELGVHCISVARQPSEFSACDFDEDFDCDGADLNLLYPEFGSAGAFDLDGSGVVDGGDVSAWLALASDPSNPAKLSADHVFVSGDINFDGTIDSTDLGLLLNRFGETGEPFYGEGNLNGDRTVDGIDLGLLLNNFSSNAATTTTVPEPRLGFVVVLAVVFLLSIRRERNLIRFRV